jgi:hypothetical protein
MHVLLRLHDSHVTRAGPRRSPRATGSATATGCKQRRFGSARAEPARFDAMFQFMNNEGSQAPVLPKGRPARFPTWTGQKQGHGGIRRLLYR